MLKLVQRLIRPEKYIGLDLGASYTTFYVPSRDEIIEVPTLITRDKKTQEIVDYGDTSRKQLGKNPSGKEVARFIDKDPLDDREAAVEFLSRCIKDKVRADNTVFHKAGVVMSVPVDCTDPYYIGKLKYAVANAFKTTSVEMVYEPLAAAIGAGYDVMKGEAVFIVDIGGRTAQAAVIAFGGLVKNGSMVYGGNQLDQDIMRYLKEKKRIEVGEITAEDLKINLGCIYGHGGFGRREGYARGKSAAKRNYGQPIEVRVRPKDIREAILGQPHGFIIRLEELIDWIIRREDAKRGITRVRQRVKDEIDQNAVLTGGTSQLLGLDTLLQKEFDMDFKVAENPMHSGIYGLKEIIHNMRKYRKLFL